MTVAYVQQAAPGFFAIYVADETTPWLVAAPAQLALDRAVRATQRGQSKNPSNSL